jgi:rhodanese-related sulfurtransferase
METLTGFIAQEWALWAAFFAILALLIALELKEYLFGPNRLSPQQVTHMINRENAVVFDFRDSSNFEKGHIIDAVNVIFTQLENKVADLNKKYKDRPVIVICDTDRQAVQADKTLRKNGFAQVFSMQGGISAWQSASLPLTKAM